MSLALVHSRARVGVHAPEVRVEVHLSGGLPSTQMVGLPEAAVRESRERVRAALLCAQFEFPARRITINLAPADLPKEGGRFDLPIALGILAASGQIDRQALGDYEFLGELALTGELRGIDGVLPAALAAAQAGRRLIVPLANGAEAAIAEHVEAFTARTLLEVCATLNGSQKAPAAELAVQALGARALPDMADVRGQPHARRALEIAAAGGHHLLLVGSPGCGKTLLASRLPGYCPKPAKPKRWKPRPLPPSAAADWIWPAGGSGPTGLLTTPPAQSPWLAVARIRAPAKSRWPTTVSCFWTSCPSGNGRHSRCCANRWNRAWSRSHARRAASTSLHASSWSLR